MMGWVEIAMLAKMTPGERNEFIRMNMRLWLENDIHLDSDTHEMVSDTEERITEPSYKPLYDRYRDQVTRADVRLGKTVWWVLEGMPMSERERRLAKKLPSEMLVVLEAIRAHPAWQAWQAALGSD